MVFSFIPAHSTTNRTGSPLKTARMTVPFSSNGENVRLRVANLTYGADMTDMAVADFVNE